MRTSLTEIKQTEQYLGGQMCAEDKLLFEAKMLTSPVLKTNVALHVKVRRIVELFYRRETKRQAEAVHQHLFNDPRKRDFQQSIHQLFKP